MARPSDKSTALWVLRRLRAGGHEAFFAGGCVRDMLLRRRSNDYDVATDATPQQVKKLFRRVLLIGAKFGVAMVIHKGRKVEVTTFRSDLSYSDGRRPDAVRFSSPREDALRRDFTINGMFYDPVGDEIIDYVGGRKDLARGIIRTIGRPQDRFAEDYLRMLRAVRFAVRFGFRIAPATAAAARNHATKITSISGERIFDELSRMLSAGSAGEALRWTGRLDLLAAILPELFADTALPARAQRRVEAVAKHQDLTLTMGALLAELKPQSIRRIARRWGASNQLAEALCFLAEHLNDWPDAPQMALCDFKRLMASPHFTRLRTLWRVQERLATHRAAVAMRIARRATAIPVARIAPKPLLAGGDLMAMGLAEGPNLGRILRAVYDAQLDERITTRRQAESIARDMIARPDRA